MHGLLRFTKMTRSVQQGAQAIASVATDEKYKGKEVTSGSLVSGRILLTATHQAASKVAKIWDLWPPIAISEVSGKYLRDGAEVKSSEESLDEEKQKKLWELSGGYVHLEGFEPIEVPPPPKEEEKKEEKKEEAKEGEAKEDGEAKTDENKTDEAKTEEQKKEDEGEKKEEEKKEEEKKEEEKKEEEKDNKTEEAKAEEPASENKEEEKKEWDLHWKQTLRGVDYGRRWRFMPDWHNSSAWLCDNARKTFYGCIYNMNRTNMGSLSLSVGRRGWYPVIFFNGPSLKIIDHPFFFFFLIEDRRLV